MSIVRSAELSVFDQAEELVGTSPNSDDLRNAMHAVITKSIMNQYPTSKAMWKWLGGSLIINNIEHLARNYEAVRTTTQTIDKE